MSQSLVNPEQLKQLSPNELAEDRTEKPKSPSNNDLALDRTELAKFRSLAAADRTLMAWIRTALSLIGFGFGIPALVKAIEPTRTYDFNPVRFTLIVGLSFITTGMLAMILGIRDYYQQVKQIQSDHYTCERTYSGVIVGVILVIIGLVSFAGVIIKSLIF